MERQFLTKIYKTNFKAIESDNREGIVEIYVSAFGNEDSDGDIMDSKAFDKTIVSNFKRIKHLLNHDRTKSIGLPIKFETDEHGLKVTSALNLEKQIVKDVFSDYLFAQKLDRTVEHSIGFSIYDRDKDNDKIIKEVRLWEYSTLNFLGANEQTPLVSIKEMQAIAETAINLPFSDDILKKLDEINIMLHNIEIGLQESRPAVKSESETINLLQKLSQTLKNSNYV